MLASFPVAFEWPSAQAGILSAISCLFDASSVVFAILSQLFFANPEVYTREAMFIGYAVCCACFSLVCMRVCYYFLVLTPTYAME